MEKITSKGYWVICLTSYEIDGKQITKGDMDYYTSLRPIINPYWRRATQKEIDNRRFYKGKTYLPNNLQNF